MSRAEPGRKIILSKEGLGRLSADPKTYIDAHPDVINTFVVGRDQKPTSLNEHFLLQRRPDIAKLIQDKRDELGLRLIEDIKVAKMSIDIVVKDYDESIEAVDKEHVLDKAPEDDMIKKVEEIKGATLQFVKDLVAKGANVEYDAREEGVIGIIRELPEDANAIIYAAYYEFKEIVKFLLDVRYIPNLNSIDTLRPPPSTQ